MTEEKKTITCMFGMQAAIGDKVLFGDKGQSCSYLHTGTVEGINRRVEIRGDQSGRLNERCPTEVFVLTSVFKEMPELLV